MEYVELMAYIQITHPTIEVHLEKENENGNDEVPPMPYKLFSICDDLGNLAPGCPCCKSKPTSMS